MSRVPPADQMRASGSARRKVALPPGRSQLDWVRNSARLPRHAPRTVPARELAAHRARNDAWIAIRGSVFDVTPYIEYHPGGVGMILAGAGKDGTKLFNKYHPWVNPDFMLSTCYLGVLGADDKDDDETEESEEGDESASGKVTDSDQSAENEHIKGTIETTSTEPSNAPTSVETQVRNSEEISEEISEELEALRVAELETAL